MPERPIDLDRSPDGSPPRVELPASIPASHSLPAPGPAALINLVLVSADRSWRRLVERSFRAGRIRVHVASTPARATRVLDGIAHDGSGDSIPLVMVDADFPANAAWPLVEHAAELGVPAILTCAEPTLEDATAALQCGALDLVHRAVTGPELVARVAHAAARSRGDLLRSRRITRLQRICRRLGEVRHLVARQVDTFCSDLVQAYQELAQHMNQATLSSEFAGLIRHELDLEALLRTTLEYVLSKSGPTNAAVFLPSSTGDFSLGAYVNYDCPKETVDVLLDHMANVVAPRFEKLSDVAHVTEASAVNEYFSDALWVGKAHLIAFPCVHDGECLAIFLFFRDAASPYTVSFLQQIKMVRELFTVQLARLVRIHHRHLPKDKWGALGDPPRTEEGDDENLAA